MPSNIDRYKTDLDSLIAKGGDLHNAIQAECFPAEFEKIAHQSGPKGRDFLNSLPSFNDGYQAWYSEAKILVKQLLPDRLADFVRDYVLDSTLISCYSL